MCPVWHRAATHLLVAAGGGETAHVGEEVLPVGRAAVDCASVQLLRILKVD